MMVGFVKKLPNQISYSVHTYVRLYLVSLYLEPFLQNENRLLWYIVLSQEHVLLEGKTIWGNSIILGVVEYNVVV